MKKSYSLFIFLIVSTINIAFTQTPVANFSINKNTLIWGESLTADASSSTGNSLTYTWNATGCIVSPANGSVVTITPLIPGEKTIYLTVSNNNGNSSIGKNFTVEPKIENISVDYTYLDNSWATDWFFPFFTGDTLLAPHSRDEVIRIYDIENSGINHLTDISMPKISNVRALRNNHLYITMYRPTTGNAGAGSISIYSIGEEWQLTPVLTDYLPGEYDNYGLSFINDYVLLRDQYSIYKTDFSNLSNPQVLTEVSYNPKRIYSTTEVGEYIYIHYAGNTWPTEYFIDVLNKNTLDFVMTLNLPTSINTTSVHDKLLFTGSREVDSLRIYGIIDPLNPILLSTISIPEPDFVGPYYTNLGYSARHLGNDLLAIDVNNGIEIYDIQNVSSPVYRGSWYNGNYPTWIKNNDGDIFIIDQIGSGITIPPRITKINFDWELSTSQNKYQGPLTYALHNNYPNPFNPITTIRYSLPESADIKLEVFDFLGKKVATLVDEYKNTGNYSVVFNAENLPSGIYFYRLLTGKFVESKKILLIK
ncbi:T9SS type A sorting domain-containing protein [Candidatus Neomarinimicrobiota bacterium]